MTDAPSDAAAAAPAVTVPSPAVDRRRRPRRTRHHEAHVHWKHIALYVPILLVVTFLGGLAIWSFVERQSLAIAAEPLPRITLVTADARSPLTAAWVRLLTDAEMEPVLVPVDKVDVLRGVVALCDMEEVPAPLAASLAEHMRRGGALAVLGRPPATPIGALQLGADPGMSDEALKLSEGASPILARLTPGVDLAVRKTPVAFLRETPRMHVDARWRTNARAVVMHMETSDARVLWLGLQPDAVARNAQLMLLLRTAFRWADGQPVSDGATGEPTQTSAMSPDARRRARTDRFSFSVDRLRGARTYSVRMTNRGDHPIKNPTVEVWLPPGVTQVALAGDWIMKRGATLSGNQLDGACLVSLKSLGRNEDRVMKLRVVSSRK